VDFMQQGEENNNENESSLLALAAVCVFYRKFSEFME